MVAAECEPFAKAGGLGDVLGALPIELNKLGVYVNVILPRYRSIDLEKFGFQPHPTHHDGIAPLGWENLPYDVHVSNLPGSPVKIFLIGNDRFFNRDGMYFDPHTGKDYADQADRWIFFNRAAM